MVFLLVQLLVSARVGRLATWVIAHTSFHAPERLPVNSGCQTHAIYRGKAIASTARFSARHFIFL